MSTLIESLPKPNDEHPENNADVHNMINAIFSQEEEEEKQQILDHTTKSHNKNLINKLCHFSSYIILISILYIVLSNEYVDEIIMSFIPYFEKSPKIIFLLFKLIIFILVFIVYILINE